MNRERYGWVLSGALLLVILFIIFWPKGCGCTTSKIDDEKLSKDSVEQLVRQSVQEALDSCRNLAKGTGGNSYSYFYSVPSGKGSVPGSSTKESTPSPKDEPTAPKQSGPEKNNPGQRGLDPSYYEGTDRNIYFCLNYDHNPAWYLPHLAIVNGEGITAVQNNQGGYNWMVPDASLSSGFSGDWGVTRDGTFFVSCSLIDRNNPGAEQIYILTTATGWGPRAMTRSGSYYIWKK